MNKQAVICNSRILRDTNALCRLYRQGCDYTLLRPLSRSIDGVCAALLRDDLPGNKRAALTNASAPDALCHGRRVMHPQPKARSQRV